MGNNEIELAEFRVEYLQGLVSHTYIAESRLTHSGNAKPLYFSEWLSRQSIDFQSRVTILEIPLDNLNSAWEREIFSREYLAAFAKENCNGEKFILSDLDEIPSRSQVDFLFNSRGIFHFLTPTYYRRINWALSDKHSNWNRGVMGDVDLLTMENGGRFSDLPQAMGSPGMHLSYLGLSASELSLKLTSFAHTEYKNFKSLEESFINYCDKYAIDHLGRVDAVGFGLFNLVDDNNLQIPEVTESRLVKFKDSRNRLPSTFSRIWASALVSVFVSRMQKSLEFAPFSTFTSSFGTWFRVSLLLVKVSLVRIVRVIRGGL